MRILAFDTSSKSCSAAVFDGTLLGEVYLELGLTHSERLLPMVESLLTLTGVERSSIDGIAVTAGPGSFTGLRIGMATAQGLAQALDVPLAPISTLYALSRGGAGFPGIVCPMMDARRGEVYAALYRGEEELLAPGPYPIETVFSKIGNEPVYLLGDGVIPYRERILEALPGAVIAPEEKRLMRGGYVAAAAHHLGEKAFVPAAQAKIDYMRLSQAERLRHGG